MTTMFKARPFSVQKQRWEEWVSGAGHNCRDLPRFSRHGRRAAFHKKSRELWQKLGCTGYQYEGPNVGAFIEFLEESLGTVIEFDPHDGKYSMAMETDETGRPVFPELRNLLLWLLEHRPSGIRALLSVGLIHLGGDLFPRCYLIDGTYTPSIPTSLLGMATMDLCSPAATEFLLTQGASPDVVLYPIAFDGDYAPTQGCGGLAIADVRDEWCFRESTNADKLRILELLMEYGDDGHDALTEYNDHPRFKEMYDRCLTIWATEWDRKSNERRQRLETVVALTGIISFWRRITNEDGSKAMRKAAKRFRSHAANMTTDL